MRATALFLCACAASGQVSQIDRNLVRQGDDAVAGSRYLEAAEFYSRACQSVLAGDGPDVPECLIRLGTIARYEGRFDEALKLYTRADLLCRVASAVCASVPYHVATLYLRTGRLGETEPVARKAVAMAQTVLGDSHPDSTAAVALLGGILVEVRKLDEAEPLLRGAIDSLERSDAGVVVLAEPRSQLATLLFARGHLSEAADLMQKHLKQTWNSLGPGHVATADALVHVAGLHRASGDPARAIPLLRQAEHIYRAQRGTGALEIAGVCKEQGLAELQLGNGAAAERLFTCAITAIERADPQGSVLLVDLRLNLVDAYLIQGKPRSAEPILIDVVRREQHQDGGSERLVRALFTLGRVYLMTKRRKDSQRAFDEAISLFDNIHSLSPQSAFALRESLAHIRKMDRRTAKRLEQHKLRLGY